MGAGRKTTTVGLKEKSEYTSTVNGSTSARNLRKADLGSVIFGCKHLTYKECMFKQLFGLPAPHFSYVKNINIGLTLFLFNYSDRKLHGIFEAASPGQLNINPYAWTSDGAESTPYAAQVRIRVRKLYHPLTEDQFISIIGDNYFAPKLFWFELDQSQTKRLVDLFSSLPAFNDVVSLQIPSKLNHPFKSSPTTGPIDAVGKIEDWEHLDHDGWADTPRLMNTDTTGNLNYEKSHASVLRSTSASTSVIEPMANSQKLWSSLFKSSASDMDKMDPTSNMDKTDPMLNSSSRPSSPFPDKGRMDWESCLPSSVDKDGQMYQAWGLVEHEERVESISSFVSCSMQNQSIPSSQQSKLSERQYTGQESEHSELTVSELNLRKLNELNIEWQSSCRGSQHAESSMDNDNVEVPDDGPTSLMGLQEEGQRDISQTSFANNIGSEDRNSEVLGMLKQVNPSDPLALVAKLMGEVEGLKRSKMEQDQKMMILEQELVHYKLELRQFMNMLNELVPGLLYASRALEEVHVPRGQLPPGINDSVVIVGGYNGSLWMPSLDSYFPSHDRVETLSQMTFPRSHAAAVKLNGELFVLGGVHNNVYFNTVESYNPLRNQWSQQPSLNEKKGCLAGASLNDKIFAFGGGNGVQCFSEVEMFDVNLGHWISAQSMMQKRFAPAATDINGAIYVAGGYDGKAYTKSVERFDPREHTWTTVGCMKTRRGCHSLVAYNEKLYSLGGYDGGKMVSSVEILDPRFGSWVMGEQMNGPRGYSGAVVIGGKIFVIGGVNDQEEILNSVECYEDGHGWQMTNSKTLGKRCFLSALVL
ncbi:uncharacterized protein LOC125875016 [Solanum stenotomum]|uniref:uncharacterized protein LOC125875016 n=1 Tax=Solanum stenotomum TaxID=172797 RepID=UPI0020D0C64A|nr:uncharacterized protein LOC125875016 [Solanum stenotomum]XP_049412024.1 uncharacterized protein LOC125875016 [Solanum stenotomum]XP_049412025.1 uncharacterized protein LOC125875016 [Solanum stenotomum]XP_049412026.1 uncharacterized protein LOC125875016 [Solanum stenotomum]